MSKLLKFGLITFGVLIVLGALLFGAWSWFTRQALPKTDGKVRLEGLDQPVEIVRDEYGVAHIYAQTPHDLFFTEGYVHAQERFWQMEFQRRTGAGRLSEIFGQSTVSTDKYLRHFGFSQSSQAAYDLMDEETKAVFDSYAEGVNAYIANRRPGQLGLEFAILGLQGTRWEIEPWTPADSLIWAQMMIYDQSDKIRSELRNVGILAVVGEEMFADYNPPYRADRPTILQPTDLLTTPTIQGSSPVYYDEVTLAYLVGLETGDNQDEYAGALLESWGYQLAGGSNSFAVSGKLTTSGDPLLANDPHMGVSMPSVWYEVAGHCVTRSPECIYNFRGYSLPGVPGILIGHNDRIAWGLTNASFDVEDLFIEKINPANPNQYEVNGKWVDMAIRYEEIKVQGEENPVVIAVRSTRNGVIASDFMVSQRPFSYGESGPELYALSYAWTALAPIQSGQAVLEVVRSQNWDDFVAALEHFDAGKQNWLYADVDGNIGYVLPGRIPIRAGGDGTMPVPGWTDDYIWTGFILYTEMPKVFNPKQGFIATGNNPQLRAEDFPYLLGMDYDYGQRAQRITSLILGDLDGVSLEDMQAIQTDDLNLSALEIVPYLRDLTFEDKKLSAARDMLLAWDGEMGMDSKEAALFNLFWAELLKGIFHDQLPSSYYPGGASGSSDAVYRLLNDPTNPWWDDVGTLGQVETHSAILQAAFERAYDAGVDALGKNLDEWKWGDLHTITFQNATLGRSGVGFIEDIFNRGPFPTNGSESVVQKTCWSATSPFAVTCIPAMRQVIDLGDLSNSLFVHGVGQSGHPMHPQYDNFIELWRNLQYHPSNWNRSDAEAGSSELLLLEPK